MSKQKETTFKAVDEEFKPFVLKGKYADLMADFLNNRNLPVERNQKKEKV